MGQRIPGPGAYELREPPKSRLPSPNKSPKDSRKSSKSSEYSPPTSKISLPGPGYYDIAMSETKVIHVQWLKDRRDNLPFNPFALPLTDLILRNKKLKNMLYQLLDLMI